MSYMFLITNENLYGIKYANHDSSSHFFSDYLFLLFLQQKYLKLVD